MHRTLIPILIGLVGLAIAGSGCRSVYHRSHTRLPSDPCDQLELRLNEARQAEESAGKAGAVLMARIVSGMSGDAITTDIDRAEAAALELGRRVASARDAAIKCPGEPKLTAEIERLEQRSKELQAGVDSARRGKQARGD